MDAPLFLHSWWRASSTYFWSLCRRDPTLLAFAEPFHELFTPEFDASRAAITSNPDSNPNLFHPALSGGGYFAEYEDVIAAGGLAAHPKSITFDEYFLAPDGPGAATDAGARALIAHAHAQGRRPVMAAVRTMGRMARLRRRFGGDHVLLLRDPADQWASMIHQLAHGNAYFLDASLLVGAKAVAHPDGAILMAPLGIAHIHHHSIVREVQIAGLIRADIGALKAFEAYYAVQLLALAHNWRAADIIIDTNHIAEDSHARSVAAQALGALTPALADLSDFERPARSERVAALIDDARNSVHQRAPDVVSQEVCAAAEAHPTAPTLQDMAARASAARQARTARLNAPTDPATNAAERHAPPDAERGA